MAQNQLNRKGYIACSISLTTTAVYLISQIETALGLPPNSLARSFREVQIQVDPETSSALSVRIGDGSLGTTVGGVVQKGVTIGGGGADTYRSGSSVSVYAGMMMVQAVSGEPIINVQLLDA